MEMQVRERIRETAAEHRPLGRGEYENGDVPQIAYQNKAVCEAIPFDTAGSLRSGH
jgi:hypothetical protein